MLSIIVPTLNAAAVLPGLLADIAAEPAAGVGEVIIADGGSTDATVAIAAAGARLIHARRGRGAQLAAGAAAARGEWLLFVHADTRLPAGWARAVAAFIAAPGSGQRAGYFRFALDDDAPAARRLERLARWRSRALALPYGDQGLLLSRAFYQQLGGYGRMPLMEDVDLVRRIGRRRLRSLDAAAITSAVRYRRGGYLLRPLRNLFCLGLYLLGVSPRYLAAFYG